MKQKFDKVLKNLSHLQHQNVSLFREVFPYDNLSSPENIYESSPSFIKERQDE